MRHRALALAMGGQIGVEVATNAYAMASEGASWPLDFGWKAAGVPVEWAAEVAERRWGNPMLNKAGQPQSAR